MNTPEHLLPQHLTIALEAACKAISAPCNHNVPQGSDLALSHLYDQIQAAQQEDESQLNSGEWSNQPKKAQWKEVINLCQNTLQTDSKDLQLIVWLMRAYSRLEGINGCYIGLQCLLAWIENWWVSGYPHLQNQDYDERIAKLTWLDKHLSRTLSVFGLYEDDLGTLNWFTWEQSLKSTTHTSQPQSITFKERWQRYVSKSHLSLAQQRDTITACLQALQKIHLELDQSMSSQVVYLRSTEHLLTRMQTKFTDWTGRSHITPHGPTAKDNIQPTIPTQHPHQYAPQQMEPITQQPPHRSQMLVELEKIARYFRAHEPFGPTAPMLERALVWANKPVNEWLSELVSDEATRRKIEDVLGAQFR